MKKVVLSAMLALIGVALYAQSLDKAKDLYKTKKLPEAKTQIDQFLAVEKNAKNSEGWYYKGKIYGDIANDNTLAATTPDARMQSFEALKKYAALDDKLLFLQLDNYKPVIDCYQGYFKEGATLYNAQKYSEALPNFKNCLAVSDYMYQKKWSTVAIDTSVLLYAGICAEKAGNKDEAASYYSKLADAKVNGEGMVEIYKWLVDYNYQKKDKAAVQKYMALGREVYPTDSFWDTMDIDMARESGDKKVLFEGYEKTLAKDPNNYAIRYNYALEMYQEGYKPNVADRPANSSELIAKSEQNLRKVLETKPDYPAANLVLGQLLFNQAIDYNTEAIAIKPKPATTTVKPKPGTPAPAAKLTPDEQKKKDDLKGMVTKKFDEAIPYLSKVDETLSPQGKLKMEEKGYLKNALDLLTTIYDQKGNKEKTKIYEEKFNNVDKVH